MKCLIKLTDFWGVKDYFFVMALWGFNIDTLCIICLSPYKQLKVQHDKDQCNTIILTFEFFFSLQVNADTESLIDLWKKILIKQFKRITDWIRIVIGQYLASHWPSGVCRLYSHPLLSSGRRPGFNWPFFSICS